MTSFTRKLHSIDPCAARAIHRQQYADYRYGKNVTLAQFAMPSTGQRVMPCIEPEFEVADNLERCADRRFRVHKR